MTIGITKENKIKQELIINLDKGTDEYNRFHNMIVDFVEKESKQEIDGKIERLSIVRSYDGGFGIHINTCKEDRLKLLKDESINVEVN